MVSEDIQLVDDGIDLGVNVLEPMGNENFLYATLGEQEVTARIDPTNRPQPGESVSFAFDEAALYLFDPETGASLKTKRDGVVPTTPDSIPNREGVESTTGTGPDTGSNDDQIEETVE